MKSMSSKLSFLAQCLILVSLMVAPWAFGAVIPRFELYFAYALGAAVALQFAALLIAGRGLLASRATLQVAAVFFALVFVLSLHQCALPTAMVQVLSPNRAAWVETAAPAVAETFEGRRLGDEAIESAARGWSYLAFNRHESLLMFLRCTSLLGVFVVVASFESPGRFLRWLAVGMVVSGTALAFVSILQHFGSPQDRFYWVFESEYGRGFGPFFNKNHFPFFANVIIGLAIGLLLERQELYGRYWYRNVFQDPTSLSLIFALMILVASDIVCVSRGGVISLAIAIGVAMIARNRKRGLVETLQSGVVIAAGVAMLFAWIGFSIAESRLSMLWEADRFANDGRFYLWQAALNGAAQFPWFGSGGETFQYWETMHQVHGRFWNSSTHMAWRADNEFIDVLCEYGVFATLALAAFTILIVRRGFLAAKSNALLMGAFIGTLSVALHSCVDFGLRIPSSGVLAMVVGACLCSIRISGLGEERPKSSQEWEDRLQVGFVAIGILGCWFVLLQELAKTDVSAAGQAAGIAQLQRESLDRAEEDFAAAVEASPQSLAARVGAARGLLIASKMVGDEDKEHSLIGQALDHSVAARHFCPLAWEPQVWLAQNTPLLETGDSRLAYLSRAELLHPSNPSIAYLAGKFAMESGDQEQGLMHWRKSLEFSSKHVEDILESARDGVSISDFVQNVVPTDPVAAYELAKAALRVWDAESAKQLHPLAIDLLRESEESPALENGVRDRLMAELYADLEEYDESIEHYRKALRFDTQNVDWRIKLARVLITTGNLEDALREARIVQAIQPENRETAKLIREISNLQAANKTAA